MKPPPPKKKQIEKKKEENQKIEEEEERKENVDRKPKIYYGNIDCMFDQALTITI